MAHRVDHLGKAGKVQTHAKPASHKPAANTKTKADTIFQTLLSNLKANEKSQPVDSLRNKPASSEIVKHGHHKVSKNPKAIQDQNAQNVNTLAASTLIAMAATLSSGPNRLSGVCSQNGGFGHPGSISGAGAVPAGQSISLTPGQEIGSLSAHFESGEKGPDVIGYDYNGGTSYGTYQISSRTGTMKHFIEYLSEQAPDMANKLKAAGPANTGGRAGRMPEVWKKITAEDPARFSKLQYDFIEKSHYLPAVQEISEKTGLDVSKGPKALQEVLWSTAVQHGPNGAARIFQRAIGCAKAKDGGVQLAKLIGTVYDMRAGQFGSSGPETRAAARNRFQQEGRIALAMLSDPFQKADGIRA